MSHLNSWFVCEEEFKKGASYSKLSKVRNFGVEPKIFNERSSGLIGHGSSITNFLRLTLVMFNGRLFFWCMFLIFRPNLYRLSSMSILEVHKFPTSIFIHFGDKI
jgi:hypothetical protein